MPPQLLPASAAAFAPRASSVNVVLGSKVEPWLTQTLKRINRVKRPLNSVSQHHRCLTETLSSSNAIWTLACLILPSVPEAEVDQDAADPMVQSFHHSQLVPVEAYIVHVDMVLRNEVAFKLTPDTIATLTKYHKEVHCVNTKASVQYEWAEKEQQCKKLHEDFVQAINKFVYRTDAIALEGLEEDGAGELLRGKNEEVMNNIKALMKPLLPPPPRVVDIIRQPPLLPSTPASQHLVWSASRQPPTTAAMTAATSAATVTMPMTTSAVLSPMVVPPPVDPWRVLPPAPSQNATTAPLDSTSPLLWAMDELSSPPPLSLPYSQPYSTTALLYSSSLTTPPISAVQLPSTLTQCGFSVGMGGLSSMGGMGGFGWDHQQHFYDSMPTM